MHPQSLISLLTLPLFTSAHFILDYPFVRGFDEDNLGTFPCGGQAQTQNRTKVSMSSFPVALTMGHDRSAVQMLLAIGNNVGDNFNIVLEVTFAEEGLGSFCLPDVVVPSRLGILEGTNATLQVVTDGDLSGGLYNCADITFTSAAGAVPSSCTNGTGVTAMALPSNEASINANESSPTGGLVGGTSTTTGGVATSTPTNQAMILTATWAVLGGVVMGVAVLL